MEPRYYQRQVNQIGGKNNSGMVQDLLCHTSCGEIVVGGELFMGEEKPVD